ncbi:MAG: GntR family transcriptional regulator [Microlunatus sp.]
MTTRAVVNGAPSRTADAGALPTLPPRLSTAEHAAAVVRTEIASGSLLPGTPLREGKVADAFGISRNTVREVFRLLAHERLVEHVAYRGVRIRRLVPTDISAMYRTRRLVEPLGIRAAMADPDAQRALRETVDLAAAAADAADWQQVGTCDIDFHRIVMGACGSRHLSEMFETLLAELRLAFLQVPDVSQMHQSYVSRNRQLLELTEAGQEDAALRELNDYLVTAEQTILSKLAD